MRKKLGRIHSKVLRGFTYKDDIDQFGVIEDWRLPEDVERVTGDCDDFAIACRYLVKQAGYESRLIICKTEKGEYHLVCSVVGYILDNRQKGVMTVSQLERRGYTWVRTSGLNPGDPWRVIVDTTS